MNKKDEVCDILEVINEQFNCTLCNDEFLSKYDFIRASGEDFSQIYIIKSNFSELIDSIITELRRLNFFPYSVGKPILIIHGKVKGKNIRDLRIEPLLPFGEIMLNYCKNIIRLPEFYSSKFIYGRELVLNFSILNITNLRNGYYLFMDIGTNFLGFGKVVVNKDRMRVIPIRDIGWYLRKGG